MSPGMPHPHTWLKAQFLAMRSIQQVIRREKSMQQSVRRARIIFLADSGITNEQIATQLKLNRLTVRTWRNRWAGATEVLATAEA